MDEFYDIIDDIANNLDDIHLRIEEVWTSGKDVLNECAEDFDNAVSYLGRAKELIDKIYIELFEKYHGEE